MPFFIVAFCFFFFLLIFKSNCVTMCKKHNGLSLLRKYEIFWKFCHCFTSAAIPSELLGLLDLQSFSEEFNEHFRNSFFRFGLTFSFMNGPPVQRPVVNDQNAYHSTYEWSLIHFVFCSVFFSLHSIQGMNVVCSKGLYLFKVRRKSTQISIFE